MSRIRYKVIVELELDKDDFPTPADGQFTLSIRDEIKDVLESNMAIEVNHVKLIKVGKQNDEEIRNYDTDE